MAKQLDYNTMKEIFTRFQAGEAHPKGELDHTNAYTLVSPWRFLRRRQISG